MGRQEGKNINYYYFGTVQSDFFWGDAPIKEAHHQENKIKLDLGVPTN